MNKVNDVKRFYIVMFLRAPPFSTFNEVISILDIK